MGWLEEEEAKYTVGNSKKKQEEGTQYNDRVQVKVVEQPEEYRSVKEILLSIEDLLLDIKHSTGRSTRYWNQYLLDIIHYKKVWAT